MLGKAQNNVTNVNPKAIAAEMRLQYYKCDNTKYHYVH